MARSDLILKLIKSATSGDQKLLAKAIEAMIADERAKNHHIFAESLEKNWHANGTLENDEKVRDLIFQTVPRVNLDDLILPASAKQACLEIIEEHSRTDVLRSHGLEPRHKILLVGPPGNGKTSLAEAIAESLSIPFITVRYEGLIGSFLGETASRLQRVFEYVRTRHCVLFFDEFDTIGKERGDTHETGEIKRVVSSLLMQMDKLPSHVIVITASNHPELLDRAAWRRFECRLELPAPTTERLEEWFSRFQANIKQPLGYSSATLAGKLAGISYAEAEQFCQDIFRKFVLSHQQADIKKIVKNCLYQWTNRASAK